jgi:hypothetical protein
VPEPANPPAAHAIILGFAALSSALTQKDELTPEQHRACELFAEGFAPDEVCKSLNIKAHQLARWREMPAFERAWLAARAVYGEMLMSKSFRVLDPDEFPDVARAKLWMDQVRFALPRWNRAEYGDRVDVNVNAVVDIGEALAAARARVVPLRYQAEAQEAEYRELTPLPAPSPTDTQSDATPAAPLAEPDIFS